MINYRKGVIEMGKKKRRRRKPAAPSEMESLAVGILAGTISGLGTAAILKLQRLTKDRGAEAQSPHPGIRWFPP